jgi:hypothetical protein
MNGRRQAKDIEPRTGGLFSLRLNEPVSAFALPENVVNVGRNEPPMFYD